MDKVVVSAPGKLMLFGEHAVVYGKPCIVTSVNQRLRLKAQKKDQPIFQLEAADVGITNYQKLISEVGKGDIPKGAKYVEVALRNFIEYYRVDTPGVSISTVSDFKPVFGFGSSSASAVCTIFALAKLFNINLSQKEIFDLSYKTVLDIAGVGSGFDLAAAIFGGTLYFVKAGKVIEPLAIGHLPIIVGYTGVKADTPTIVKDMQAKRDKDPKFIDNIFAHVGQIVIKAKEALLKKDYPILGKLMDQNQEYLEKLGVSSKILDKLIKVSRDAGAYGAKLSGAGFGDCMIALVPEDRRKQVRKAIEKVGGQVLKVETNVKGVRIES